MYQKTACFGRISIFRFKILLEGQRTLYFRFKLSEALGMFHIKLSAGVENDIYYRRNRNCNFYILNQKLYKRKEPIVRSDGRFLFRFCKHKFSDLELHCFFGMVKL